MIAHGTPGTIRLAPRYKHRVKEFTAYEPLPKLRILNPKTQLTHLSIKSQ